MQPDFKPLFRNPHLATIAGNFWRRPKSLSASPIIPRLYRITSDVTVVAAEQHPVGRPIANIVSLHGLEGSSDAGYLQSFGSLALSSNYSVHKLNLRTCGGTEDLSSTMYHSGLTSDTAVVIDDIAQRTGLPVFLVGFSLGGNVALKLAGEQGSKSQLRGVVTISAPIDLARCVRAIDKASNRIYASRFLDRLKARIKRKSLVSPETYNADLIHTLKTIWQFDDRFTAPLFGFGSASNYYATQSALNYIGEIRTPTLLIASKDDPLVPFGIYEHPDIQNNSAIELISPEYGGHIGFLSSTSPRFWVDTVALNWIQLKCE